MRDLKLDGNGLAGENFDLVLIEGDDSTVQRLTQKFNLWLGEWFLNVGAGVPWRRDILGQKPNDTVVAGLIRDIIVNDPGISELIEATIDFAGSSRELEISFRARSALTENIIDSEVIINA
jgi:hypothetical protein